jgi:17beta-estradiol 17-dehydrogenase / very-long-chain 3-oxoacyl-CoA reductase
MTFLRPGKNLKKLGKWAVVTGATDGIGKAYAMALAKKGMSVVLISRTEAKLKEVQGEIIAKGYNGVEVKYIVCDYSKFDQASKAAVKKVLDELEIGVLVNNVGVSYRYPLFFHELSDEEVATLLTMNVESTVWMTRMVLPGMLTRKSGAIVNISSGSALYTLPLLAEYSGAKSFVEKFSRAINAEYRAKGITCQCQVPFYVATKLAKMRKSLTVPTPTEYVSMAIKWVGYPDALVQPFWIHGLQGWIMHQIPDIIIAKGIMAMHMAIRSKGLKKDARLAEDAKGKKN